MTEDDARLYRMLLAVAEGAAAAGDVKLAQAYTDKAFAVRAGFSSLTTSNHSDTLSPVMITSKRKEKAPRVTQRALAEMLGCTQGYLSQAENGTKTIRKSWAERIAAVDASRPATRETWPGGWAEEEE